jgi:hypothetical protein
MGLQTTPPDAAEIENKGVFLVRGRASQLQESGTTGNLRICPRQQRKNRSSAHV